VDYYADIDAIKEAFLRFANTVPFYGSTVLCLDDAHIRDILPAIKRRIITYGMSDSADYRISDIRFEGMTSQCALSYRGKRSVSSNFTSRAV